MFNESLTQLPHQSLLEILRRFLMEFLVISKGWLMELFLEITFLMLLLAAMF